MTKKRTTKGALLVSALALLVCVTMLIGSTFAWFTDSVTSAGNIIKSGTLEVTMEWKDATANGAQQSYKDASQGAIFNYDKWEPGYVEAKNLQISNKGTLALKYQLNVIANGEVSDLANVIDVYFAEGEITLADRTMTELKKIGTLKEVLAGMPANVSGDLLENETDKVTIALKMQEDAGNEYQNLAIGSDFAVQLLATQLTAEDDAFDNQYDVDASYAIEVKTADDLQIALRAGGAVKLVEDITLADDAQLTIPEGANTVLYMNGKNITGAMDKSNGDLIINKGALTIVGDSNAVITNTTVNGGALIVNEGTLTLKGGNYVGGAIGTTGYPDYAIYSSGKLTVEEGTSVVSDRGALNVSGEVVINGGSFEVTDAASSRALTCHTVYAHTTGSLTINGGNFENNYSGVSGASVICPAGAAISIYGGNFSDPVASTANFNNTGNIQNYMGYSAPVKVYGGTFNDATVNKNLAEGHITVDNGDGTAYVIKGTAAATQDAMEQAFKNGEKTVVLDAGTYEFPTLVEGATIIGKDGVVFEDTLSGTLNNVTIKNVHIKDGNAQRWAYSKGTLLFEDCTFEATSVYAIHYDGLNGANITYKNCTIIGWAAIGSGAEYVTFDGCKIYGNGAYGVLRLYSPATIKNCTFDVDNVNTTDIYQDGIHAVDCEIKVSNNVNVNGQMSDIYNVSGTGVITEQ